jgi:hypothetical protein
MSILNLFSVGAVSSAVPEDSALPGLLSSNSNLDKSAGTTASTVAIQTAEPNGLETADSTVSSVTNNEHNDSFTIGYSNVRGEAKSWKFVLLPAIETNLTLGVSSGLVRGNGAQVPEVKPGILTHTIMKQKNIPIPGGVPVVQTIGIESQFIQLVGAFLGTENSTTTGLDAIYTGSGNAEGSAAAGRKAEEFRDNVVQQGAPITIKISLSGRSIQARGVIKSFKFYDVRHNRAYYSMDILYTEYAANKNVKPPSRISTSTLEQKEQAKDFKKLTNPDDVALGIQLGVGAAKASPDGTYSNVSGSTFTYNSSTGDWNVAGTLLDQLNDYTPAQQKDIRDKVDRNVRGARGRD